LAHWGTNCAWPRLGSRLKRTSVEEIFKQPERSTKDVLKSEGFRQEIIHRFFRPFVGGILLDSELKTTSRMFEFVFKMLSEGSTRVPARGMGRDTGADCGEIQCGCGAAVELARRIPARK